MQALLAPKNLVRLSGYPHVLQSQILQKDGSLLLRPAGDPDSGNLRITKDGSAANFNGARGAWARFIVEPSDDSKVILRSVGHREAGRDVYLALASNRLCGAAQPVAFSVTDAAEAEVADGQALDAAETEVVDGQAPEFELTDEMKREFAREGFIVLPGLVAPELVNTALQAINAQLGAGSNAWQTDDEDGGMRLGGNVGRSTPISDLLYRSPAHGVAEQLLGKTNRPAGGQVALRFPCAPNDAAAMAREKRDEQWHIDGMNKQSHMSPFDILMGVALSDQPEEGYGNLGVWPGSHLPIHEAVKRQRAKRATAEREKEGELDDESIDGSVGGAEDPWLGERPKLSSWPMLHVKAGAGSIVLAHQKLAHRITFNKSPHVRYQIYFRLSADRRNAHAPLGGVWDNFRGLAQDANFAAYAAAEAEGPTGGALAHDKCPAS